MAVLTGVEGQYRTREESRLLRAVQPEVTSETRRKLAERMRTYAMLSEHPIMQMEAVANHYARMAASAMQMRHLVFMHRERPSPASEQIIIRMLREFQEYHSKDLGLALEWPSRTRNRGGES